MCCKESIIMKNIATTLIIILSLLSLSLGDYLTEENKPLEQSDFSQTSGRAASDWEWSTSFGSPSADQGWGIVVNQNGESLVTGHFSGTVNFGTCSTCTHTSQGLTDIFIAKLDSQGVAIWVNTAGGAGTDAPIGLITELDNGNYAISGYIAGTNTAQFGSTTLSPSNVRALLVAVFDDSGNWVWANEYSGAHSTSDVRGYDITSDSSHIYVTGDYVRSMEINGVVHNANIANHPGAKDLFVMKLDYSGNVAWSQFPTSSGPSHDGGRGISVDSNGDVYISGRHSDGAQFGSTTLVNSPPPSQAYNYYEGLIAKLDSSGNWLWAVSHFGFHHDIVVDIEVSPSGNFIAATQITNQVSFGSTNGIISGPFSNGANHMVALTNYNSDGELIWYDVMDGHDNFPVELSIAPGGEVFLCGWGQNFGAIDSVNSNSLFDSQWQGQTHWSLDVWVAKYQQTGELDWVVASGPDQANSKVRDCALNQDNVPYVAGSFDGESIFSSSHQDTDGIVDTITDAVFGKLVQNYSSPNPDPCHEFNGSIGPVWETGVIGTITQGEIYEFPDNSGIYWQVVLGQTNSNVPDPGTNPDIWSPACTCYEIWAASPNPLVWDSSTSYSLYQIVEHPAGSTELWQAVDNSLNEIPDDPNNWRYWERCAGTECASFNGQTGPVWDDTTLNTIFTGEIYEFPANSGYYWMALQDVSTNADPGPNQPDIWSPRCNCSQIWQFGGQQIWDANQPYTQHEIVESPAGSGDYWSLTVANSLGGASPEFSLDWNGCGDTMTPCEEAANDNNNWPMWTVTGAPYGVGDVVSYENQFYISIRPINTIEPGDIGVAVLAWVECSCDQLIPGLPEYDPSISYLEFDGVVHNNEVYWAIYSVPAGNAPGPNQYWRTCNWCESSDNNIEGEWDLSWAVAANYMIGDLVTVNGQIWMSVMDYNPTVPIAPGIIGIILWGNVSIPPMWDVGWIICNCSEVATLYDPALVYAEGDVVIGPDDNVWISEYSNNGNWPSIEIPLPWATVTIPTWRMCASSTCINPMAWDTNTANYGGYFQGDAVSHLGTNWILMPGNSGASAPPAMSMIMNPGPWTSCSSSLSNNVTMYIISQGEVNIEAKSIEIGDLVENEDDKGLASLEGGQTITGFNFNLDRTSNSEVNNAIWLRKSITEISNSSLQKIIESNILVVDVCDSRYGLNGYDEEKYLCGSWYEETVDEMVKIILVPGMLCSDDLDRCNDVILDISSPVESSEGSDLSEGSEDSESTPGFSIITLILAFFCAVIFVQKKQKND